MWVEMKAAAATAAASSSSSPKTWSSQLVTEFGWEKNNFSWLENQFGSHFWSSSPLVSCHPFGDPVKYWWARLMDWWADLVSQQFLNPIKLRLTVISVFVLVESSTSKSHIYAELSRFTATVETKVHPFTPVSCYSFQWVHVKTFSSENNKSQSRLEYNDPSLGIMWNLINTINYHVIYSINTNKCHMIFDCCRFLPLQPSNISSDKNREQFIYQRRGDVCCCFFPFWIIHRAFSVTYTDKRLQKQQTPTQWSKAPHVYI